MPDRASAYSVRGSAWQVRTGTSASETVPRTAFCSAVTAISRASSRGERPPLASPCHEVDHREGTTVAGGHAQDPAVRCRGRAATRCRWSHQELLAPGLQVVPDDLDVDGGRGAEVEDALHDAAHEEVGLDARDGLPQPRADLVGGLLVAGILYLLLSRTDLGKAIRAVAEEREGAALMGIDTERISLITFGLGTACAGAAGSLIMPFFTATPTMGETFNIMAFVVVVLGGMGNIPGAMLGGIIVGITESLGAVFLPGSSKQLGVFVVFILVLLFRPTGLLGRRNGQS